MRKKVSGIILTLAFMFAITLGFIPGVETATVVHAATDSGVCYYCGNIAWELDGTVLTVSKAENAESGEMCDNCFWNWRSYVLDITDLVIEEGITVIGESAFDECVHLKSVIIPNGVSQIKDSAFEICKELTSITLPDSVESIGEKAFYNSGLTKINLPDGIQEIAANTFQFCNLTEIDIPDSVKSIGTNAFYGCESMTSITIPAGVTTIGECAFAYCKKVTGITIPNKIETIEKGVFEGCESLTKIVIPAGVISIGENAFYDCKSLSEITIPDSVIKIGNGAFYQCKSLAEIDIPDDITSIGDITFYKCSSLTEIDIPAGVTSIGENAFYECSGLTEVTIPDSVTSIGVNAFYECSGLTEITIPEGVTSIGSGAFLLCRGLTDITIPDSVTDIGEFAFMGISLKSVILPCGLKDCTSIFGGNPVYTYTHPVRTCTANDTADTLNGMCACGQSEHTITLTAPAELVYSGKAIEATYTGNIPGYTPTITYSGNNLIDTKPVVPGTYTAQLTYDESTSVSLQYTIKAVSAPAKPHKITNVVSGIHVYWPAASGTSRYGLWRSENGVNGTYKLITSTTATHYTDTKTESGKTYYYKVSTIDTAHNVHSEKSAARGITYVGTPDITLRVNRGTGIGLGWDKIPGATGYAIYRKPYDGSSAWVRVMTITDPNTLKWDDTSVKTANGTVYRYTVRALAGSNLKTLSGCRSIGRTMVRLTSRELNSAVKTGSTSIKCNWETTVQATGYEVRFMVGDTVYKTYTIGNYKTGTKTFKDLKPGQTYKIQVRTYKKVEGVGSFYSAWSLPKMVSL